MDKIRNALVGNNGEGIKLMVAKTAIPDVIKFLELCVEKGIGTIIDAIPKLSKGNREGEVKFKTITSDFVKDAVKKFNAKFND